MLTWNSQSLTNGWSGSVSASADTPTGAGAAIVRLKGSMTGKAGTVAFTLGAGSRPGATLFLNAMDFYGPHSFGLRRVAIMVGTDGTVTPCVAVNANTGSEPITVTLDGLSFAGEA